MANEWRGEFVDKDKDGDVKVNVAFFSFACCLI